MRWPWQTRQTDLTLAQWLGQRQGGDTFADAVVTSTDQALSNSAVWACVQLIANTISTLPVDALRGGAEVASPLLLSPAAGWSWSEWCHAVLVSLLLRGNCYGVIVGRTGLAATQVELLHPDYVATRVTPEGSVETRYRGEVVDPSDLWRVRAYTFPGLPYGLGPIEFARTTMELGIAMEKFGKQYFEEGSMPTGILSVPTPAGQDQVNALRERLTSRTRGHRDAIITSGGTTWTQLGISNEDSQFIESQRWNVAQVARVFNIPPEMIGGDSGDQSTYANLEARSAAFLQYALTPWLVRLEESVSALLPRGTIVKFRTQGLLRSTTAERYTAYATALQNGFMTVAEVREKEDLPPMEAG